MTSSLKSPLKSRNQNRSSTPYGYNQSSKSFSNVSRFSDSCFAKPTVSSKISFQE